MSSVLLFNKDDFLALIKLCLTEKLYSGTGIIKWKEKELGRLDRKKKRESYYLFTDHFTHRRCGQTIR